MSLLLNKGNFFYYTNNSMKYRQGLEVINFYNKEIDSFIYFTNLKNFDNVKKTKEILQIFKDNNKLLNKPFSFVIIDNEKVKKFLLNFLLNFLV
jgi:hypothetical protein